MLSTSSEAMGLVAPQTLRGFQDLLPEQMVYRNKVVELIRGVYETFGFVPVDTPVLEYLATLLGTGGEDTNKQIYRLKSPEREDIGMRFDLTVPFARLLAQYGDKLKLPFRRYHIGPVFRADKPGPDRFRQITQFDVDAAGSDSVAVDAEIIAAMCQTMRKLTERPVSGDNKHPVFLIKINNRKLMDALAAGHGIDDYETRKHVLRVVDKLEKVGIDNVRLELGAGRVDESGDTIRGVGLPQSLTDNILQFTSIRGNTRLETIDELRKCLPEGPSSESAINEMSKLARYMESLGIGEDEAIFDPSLTRGLDYYTGPVFETMLLGAKDSSSVMGGGRYDGLVSRFLEAQVPATGASIGLERLIKGLGELGLADDVNTIVQVMIVQTPGVPREVSLQVATELRKQGLSTEVYIGADGLGLSAQLSLANARKVPVAIILGESELASGTVAVKDLRVGSAGRSSAGSREEFERLNREGQATVSRGEMVATVRRMLGTS